MQKLINIVLPVLTVFNVLQWLNQPPSPLSLTQSKPDVKGSQRKKWSRLYNQLLWLTFLSFPWPSKTFQETLFILV